MKKVTLTLAIAALVTGVLTSQGHTQKADDVETFMRAKLQHSQKVLEGLTTKDFDLIAKHSQEMSLLSLAAQWKVLQTPEYTRRSAEFRGAIGKLTEAGKKKNLDGATLAFVDVTIKCVECHKFVRSVRNARFDDFDLPRLDSRSAKVGLLNQPDS